MDDSKKKWYLFAGLAVIVIGLVVLLIMTVFVPSGTVSEAGSGSVVSVIPEGEAERMEASKSKVYRGSTEDYYKMLDAVDPAAEDIPLTSDSPAASAPVVEPVSARPEAAAERVFGSAPSQTPAPASGPRHSSGGGGVTRHRTEEERLEYDRRRAEMVRDVLTGASGEEASRKHGTSLKSTRRSFENVCMG